MIEGESIKVNSEKPDYQLNRHAIKKKMHLIRCIFCSLYVIVIAVQPALAYFEAALSLL